MERRTFLAASAAASVGISKAASGAKKPVKSENGKFKLKYAPGLKTFNGHAGPNIVDNIKFIADQGFTAVFDNKLAKRTAKDQELIANELAKHGLELGPFILYADLKNPAFVLDDKDVRKMLISKTKEGVEVAKRTGAKWGLVAPGTVTEKLHMDYQTANVIENLRYCTDVVEESGLVLVLEPLNVLTNHPGVFLQGIPQSYMIFKAVNSPLFKNVNDLYHQQITEGNLIPNMDMAWDEIASIHLGDNPGRKEPGTGEINYKNIFKHLYNKKYDGVLCMEHGTSIKGIKGEKALIEAYRQCDSF
jgi:hydroxypyruvate isomerase